MDENNTFIVGGYAFETALEADRAAREQKASEFIRQKLEFAPPEKILVIYNKVISEKMFETPVGLEFLMDIRKHLLNVAYIEMDKVQEVPVPTKVGENGEASRLEQVIKNDGKKKGALSGEAKKWRGYFTGAVIIVIVLIGVVLAMFYVSQSTDNVTILNYKEQLVNQYEEWESHLEDREAVIREYEQRYGIDSSQAMPDDE